MVDYIKLNNGLQYKIYYPDNVDPNNIDPNTQVALYMHGGGNSIREADDALRYIENGNNTNSIIIIPNASSRNNDNYYNNVVDIYEGFIKDNGLNQNSLVLSGYSSGYRSTFGVLNEYLDRHPDSDPASVYLVETYPQNGLESADAINGRCYDYDAYKKNNTMFYSYTGKYGYEGDYHSLGTTYTSINDPLADNGCNVVNILEGRKNSHWGAEQIFFEDGIIDFSSGNIELTDDQYIYKIKNPNTGLWEEVNVNEINTLEKMCARFGLDVSDVRNEAYFANLNYLSSLELNNSSTIGTDPNTLYGNINNIYSVIKSGYFVSNKYASNLNMSSTTKVPSSISEIINDYFSLMSNLLCNLAILLKKCEESETLIEDTEKNIGDEAVTLNNEEQANLDNYNIANVNSDGSVSSVAAGAGALATGSISVATSILKDNGSLKQGANDLATNTNQNSNLNTNNGNNESQEKDNNQQSNINTDNSHSTSKQNDSTDNNTSTSQNIPSQEQPSSVNSWLEEFPELSELYSTNDKLVFNYNDEYRIIVHRDGDVITGIEYYYDFGSAQNAQNALNEITNKYANVNNIDNIMMKDQYIKVVFNANEYSNLSVNDFRNKYNNLSEIIKL